MGVEQYWPGIKGAIASHVANETASFTPNASVSQPTFDAFLNEFFPEPSLQDVRDAIRSKYNCTALYGGDFRMCTSELIRDSTFTCNTRQLFEAFSSVTYMLRYAFPDLEYAVHASDLIPTIMNDASDAYNMLLAAKPDLNTLVALGYAETLKHEIQNKFQSYLSSFAQHGDPNTGNADSPLSWPVATAGEQLSGVMQVENWVPLTTHFTLVNDTDNLKSTCGFWTGIAEMITPNANAESVSSGEDAKSRDEL